jgi:hypothetical protein
MGDATAAPVRRAGAGIGGRAAAGAALLALALLPAGEARATGFDLVFGGGRVEGAWLGDEDVALDDLFLQVEFGGPTSRVSIRAPYVRIDRTGNQTFSPEGPIVLGAGGFGRPPWQENEAGESASGFGDVLVRTETWLVKSGPGNKPTVSLVADYKWATADEAEGLGTGESDYGGGFDYLQPLGKRFQIRGEAFYRFTGSPEGVDFKDRLWLAGGFAILGAHTAWRLGYETVSPVLDEVPLYDASGVAIGVAEVEDYEVVRGEAMFRNQAGGSVKIWGLVGLNDSSPDIGFGLAFASKAL